MIWILALFLAGDLPITPPKGWKVQRDDAGTTLSPPDLPAAAVYAVVLPRLDAKTGSLEALFAAGKRSLGETGTFTSLKDAAPAKTEGGWEFLLGLGSLAAGTRTFLAQVVALRKEGEEGLILVIADGAETLEKHADAFTAMVRGVGAPAPAGLLGYGFQVPPGWVRKNASDSVTLEKVENEGDRFGLEQRHRIVLLPSRPFQGPLRAAFTEFWSAALRAHHEVKIVPLPLLRRLRSGAACAYDGDPATKSKEGGTYHATACLVAKGGRMAALAGFHSAFSEKIEKEIAALVESVDLPGDGRVPLFDPADLSGEWSTSSASLASYVTSTGAYAGDATVASAQFLTLRGDGSFSSTLAGVGRGAVVREKDEGRWSVEDGILVLAGREMKRHVLHGFGTDAKVGAFLVISPYSDQPSEVEFSYPRRPFSATWLKRKE